VAKLIALALVTPWFAYASSKFGVEFWHVIFGNQVYERLTVGLDPSHVHSGSHYFARLYESLNYSGVFVLVAAGGLVLLVDTIRRRSTEGVVVLLWFALPFGAISLLASKLYYYADSFLPPVGLAGGCLMAFFWRQLRPVVCRFIEEMDQRVTTWVPGLKAARRQLVVRRFLLGIATAAGVITVWTLAFGPVHISLANVRVLKSGGFLRPWLIAAVCGVLGGSAKQVGRFLGVPLLMLVILPVPAYRETLARLVVQKHPMRTALTCVEGVRSEGAGGMAWHGLYIAGPDSAYDHGHIYYFRRLRPWDRAQEPPCAFRPS
jgi:hypothetical protein